MKYAALVNVNKEEITLALYGKTMNKIICQDSPPPYLHSANSSEIFRCYLLPKSEKLFTFDVFKATWQTPVCVYTHVINEVSLEITFSHLDSTFVLI